MQSTIKVLVMDVDGTLTDGKIYMSSKGELQKAFNVKDGYGIVRLKSESIIPIIITGRESDIVTARAKELGIHEVYQGIHDKIGLLQKIVNEHGLSLEEVAYIGDDLNDLDAIKACGYSGCPSDAVSEVQKNVDFNSSKPGGSGAVREFIDQILALNSSIMTG